MSDSQSIYFETNGELCELDATVISLHEDNSNPYDEEMGVRESVQQAQELIRNYSEYALSAFKELSIAKVEEVTLKFGIKLGGKQGIPFVTEGSAEANLQVEIKCKFPD